MSDKVYKVAEGRIVWSNKHQKHFYAGETIDLSHAAPAEIATVLNSGAIVDATPETKPETKKKES